MTREEVAIQHGLGGIYCAILVYHNILVPTLKLLFSEYTNEDW